jgi:hypothetical protein
VRYPVWSFVDVLIFVNEWTSQKRTKQYDHSCVSRIHSIVMYDHSADSRLGSDDISEAIFLSPSLDAAGEGSPQSDPL